MRVKPGPNPILVDGGSAVILSVPTHFIKNEEYAAARNFSVLTKNAPVGVHTLVVEVDLDIYYFFVGLPKCATKKIVADAQWREDVARVLSLFFQKILGMYIWMWTVS